MLTEVKEVVERAYCCAGSAELGWWLQRGVGDEGASLSWWATKEGVTMGGSGGSFARQALVGIFVRRRRRAAESEGKILPACSPQSPLYNHTSTLLSHTAMPTYTQNTLTPTPLHPFPHTRHTTPRRLRLSACRVARGVRTSPCCQ